MRTLALAVLLGCSFPALSAHAADAVVLSIGGDAPPAIADEARAAATAALEADGVLVVPHADVALRIAPARLRALTSLADARSLAFELEARTIVGVAVWMGAADPAAPDAARVESVVVSLLVGSRTFSASRELGEGELAPATTAAMQDVRSQQTRAMMIEGGRLEASPEPGAADPGAIAPGTIAPGALSPIPAGAAGNVDSTPGFDFIGPTMLGAFGAAGIGMGVYSSLDATCERRGAITDVCLKGEDPNLAIGVTLMVAGTLALAGAIVWFATGATVIANQPRIDVVLGPEGGMVSVRGDI